MRPVASTSRPTHAEPGAPDNAADLVVEVEESPVLTGSVGAKVNANTAGGNTQACRLLLQAPSNAAAAQSGERAWDRRPRFAGHEQEHGR